MKGVVDLGHDIYDDIRLMQMNEGLDPRETQKESGRSDSRGPR